MPDLFSAPTLSSAPFFFDRAAFNEGTVPTTGDDGMEIEGQSWRGGGSGSDGRGVSVQNERASERPSWRQGHNVGDSQASVQEYTKCICTTLTCRAGVFVGDETGTVGVQLGPALAVSHGSSLRALSAR